MFSLLDRGQQAGWKYLSQDPLVLKLFPLLDKLSCFTFSNNWEGNTVRPIFSKHSRDNTKLLAIDRCLLNRGSAKMAI